MHAPLITDPTYRDVSQLMLVDVEDESIFFSDAEDVSRESDCADPRVLYDPRCVSGWAMSRTRRAVDFSFAAFALLLTSPIMLVVAIFVRLSSKGPALFRQERMGRNGEVFTLYKFRSMRLAPVSKRDADWQSHTVIGDQRITLIGRLLRKYKLDELPQFWNIMRGDMSLIGPRPKLPHHEAIHMPFRPGITGAATLAFRYEEEMLGTVPAKHLDVYYDRHIKPRKAEIDWEYMTQASLRSDLRIVWLTIKACLGSEESDWQVSLPKFTPESAD